VIRWASLPAYLWSVIILLFAPSVQFWFLVRFAIEDAKRKSGTSHHKADSHPPAENREPTVSAPRSRTRRKRPSRRIALSSSARRRGVRPSKKGTSRVTEPRTRRATVTTTYRSNHKGVQRHIALRSRPADDRSLAVKR
jgi:hypothetical protein